MNLEFVMQTSGGYPFDLMNPTPEMVRPRDIVESLGRICRYGGHLKPGTYYSVAEHSTMCCFLAPEGLKREALLHDAAEAYYGDIIRPLKNLIKYHSEQRSGGLSIFDKIDLVVREALKLEKEIPKEVHEIDDRMIASEKMLVLSPQMFDWPTAKPYDAMWLLNLGPKAATELFTMTWKELEPGVDL